MFDEFRDAGDAALVTEIGASGRAESIAAARRLAAIAELVTRHACGDTRYGQWSCDNWDFLASQVAAAQNISHGTASGQMYLAVGLRDRLPKVGALLAQGAISLRLASSIAWRTALIKNPEATALVDAALAEDATRYGPLSEPKTAQAIDALIDKHDPEAIRRTRGSARGRCVNITIDDADSIGSLWGKLLATDAALLERRLDQMARGVCDDDPRTLDQRRADAMGALATGATHLTCACGRDDCPMRDEPDPRATAVNVHVVADPAALTAESDPHVNGEEPTKRMTRDMSLREWLTRDPEPPAIWLPAGHIMGGGTVPASQLAALVAAGAKVAPIDSFTEASPWPGYRPPVAMDRFVRCRDMTCRFPGCDRPAEYSDIDHTVPYPWGPTHPSGLKCLCRKHHLLKTFWGGPKGWRERQLRDGTVIWTSPTGHTYTTRPGSRLLFPTLCRSTGDPPTKPITEPRLAHSGLMMPTRRRTRQQDRASRIDAERALNRPRRN